VGDEASGFWVSEQGLVSKQSQLLGEGRGSGAAGSMVRWGAVRILLAAEFARKAIGSSIWAGVVSTVVGLDTAACVHSGKSRISQGGARCSSNDQMAKQTHMQEVLVKLDVSLEQLQKGLGRLEGRLSGVMRPMMEAPTLREQSNGMYVAVGKPVSGTGHAPGGVGKAG